MTKIIIHADYGGGFDGCDFSDEAKKMYKKLGGVGKISYASREDPVLVQVVEALGKKSEQWNHRLKVEEIPDGAKWEVDEYDGYESITIIPMKLFITGAGIITGDPANPAWSTGGAALVLAEDEQHVRDMGYEFDIFEVNMLNPCDLCFLPDDRMD